MDSDEAFLEPGMLKVLHLWLKKYNWIWISNAS